MASYTLVRTSRPRISAGQAEIVYMCLEPYGSIHNLEELVSEASGRNYKATFKRADSTTIEESLLYHLHRFIEMGIVRMVDDQNS